jgi:hypothetical protein
MSTPINMHFARTAMNNDDSVRQWVEDWLKKKERLSEPAMTDEEFEKHWRYVRPERVHAGAIDGVTAYRDWSTQHSAIDSTDE